MIRFLKAVLRLIVLLCLAGLLLFAYARYVEPHLLITEEVSIYSTHVTPEQKELNIVVFADTHFSDNYTIKDFERAVGKINDMEPDLVFFLGDLIDHYDRYEGSTEAISEKLSEIRASYGKFAVFGNHDYGGGAERHYKDIMTAGGFQVLVNQRSDLKDLGVTIVGIDDVIIGYGDPTAASQCRPESFNIVLAHEPDLVTEMTDYDIDLMLSGHTHGGQVRIPYLSDAYLPPYGQQYERGIYRFENERQTTLYVNSGLGTTYLPLRFRCPPELTEFSLTDDPDASSASESE
ncbi:metallophosphoesterase [Bacilliculturomica massiliensis]|uniref:metallophosphoesterase n=1 Tax=Bacilliculturomica massiliensis TaxID=1917867 RepID=UPI0013EF5916|nr:metallophosphoesterase [Bacilliculturomica massiliensis]